MLGNQRNPSSSLPTSLQHQITGNNFKYILQCFHNITVLFFISFNLNEEKVSTRRSWIGVMLKNEEKPFEICVQHFTSSSSNSTHLVCRAGNSLMFKSSRSVEHPILPSISSNIPDIILNDQPYKINEYSNFVIKTCRETIGHIMKNRYCDGSLDLFMASIHSTYSTFVQNPQLQGFQECTSASRNIQLLPSTCSHLF